MRVGEIELEWRGHDCFRLIGPGGRPVVYVDPFRLGGRGRTADAVLITHDHYDHCSPEDVRWVSGPETAIVAPKTCARKLRGIGGKFFQVKPGDSIRLAGIEVVAVPAYNTRPDRMSFHPREKGYVGYVLTLGGLRVYHAGDTDLIPEMEGLKVDVALLPVSGTYVMDAEEAAAAARAISPRIVIPMHYGEIVGSRKDAERFASLVDCCEVILLERSPP